MKSLNNYIKSDKSSLISLSERLIVNRSFKDSTIKVNSKKELSDIIYDRLTKNPEELYLNDLDVSSIKDFSGIFSSYMFSELRKTKKIHIEGWNTENATNMSGMFQACSELEEVDVSNFDVSNVTIMEYMFRRCFNLKKLDLTNWNVSNVEDMEKMFFRCESLETIGDVSGWEPKSLELFDRAFDGCKVLKNVDTSKWSKYFSNIISSAHAFNNCPHIQIPDWAER